MEKIPIMKPGENKVSFISEGQKLAGLLYLPEDYQKGEKRPAIVFIRPGTGVKEQTAGLYAKLLSEKGFVTLAFDPRGFGESEGLVRLARMKSSARLKCAALTAEPAPGPVESALSSASVNSSRRWRLRTVAAVAGGAAAAVVVAEEA
mgnify:CR=1 FL=1